LVGGGVYGFDRLGEPSCHKPCNQAEKQAVTLVLYRKYRFIDRAILTLWVVRAKLKKVRVSRTAKRRRRAGAFHHTFAADRAPAPHLGGKRVGASIAQKLCSVALFLANGAKLAPHERANDELFI
jgi:hypothetical protein